MRPVSSRAFATCAAVALAAVTATAQDAVKIGFIVPMTGGQSPLTGKQLSAGGPALYSSSMATQLPDEKIELILRDDGAPSPRDDQACSPRS